MGDRRLFQTTGKKQFFFIGPLAFAGWDMLDPSLSLQLETMGVNEIVFKVDWRPLATGPVGEYLEVVDYDPASGVTPLTWTIPGLAQDGLPPSEGRLNSTSRGSTRLP
jgi:hypothetical protein